MGCIVVECSYSRSCSCSVVECSVVECSEV